MTDTTVKLPIWDSIIQAWHKVHGAKQTVWGALLLIIAIMVGFAILSGIANAIYIPLGSVISFISQIFFYLLIAGMIYIGLQRAQDTPISYKMVFRAVEWRLGAKLILLYILKCLIMLPFVLILLFTVFISAFLHVMTMGFSHASETVNAATVSAGFSSPLSILAFIIVGCAFIYTFTRIMLAVPFLLMQNTGAWEAIVLSFRATRCNFWRIVGWYISLWLIMVISIIPVGIGLIWTLPLVYIAYGMVYKTLSANANNSMMIK